MNSTQKFVYGTIAVIFAAGFVVGLIAGLLL